MAEHLNPELPIHPPPQQHQYQHQDSSTDSTSDSDSSFNVDDPVPEEIPLDEVTEALGSPEPSAQQETQISTPRTRSEISNFLESIVTEDIDEDIMAPDDRTIQNFFIELKSKHAPTRRRAAVELKNAVFAAYRGINIPFDIDIVTKF